jgi:hypothetical protein
VSDADCGDGMTSSGEVPRVGWEGGITSYASSVAASRAASDSPALNMVLFIAQMFFDTSSICLSETSLARSRIAMVFVTSSGAGRVLPRWSTLSNMLPVCRARLGALR